MLDFKLDLSPLDRYSDRLAQAERQLPFALSKAMNDAAKQARESILPQVWASHVEARDPGFLKGSLRTNFATKRNLVVEVYDARGRAHLKKHAVGGTKQPKGRFAIPNPAMIRRTARGVIPSQRPKAIIAKTPKRALRVTPKGIYIGKGGRLHLAYAFAANTRQPADVPFLETWAQSMAIGMRRAFPQAMAYAMRTAR